MYKFDTSNVLACLSVKSLNLYDLPQYCKLDFNVNKLIKKRNKKLWQCKVILYILIIYNLYIFSMYFNQ